ncbi:MAG TPA: hypothetical protein VF802_02590 [Candidatus Limnocylindrales bacterium]
MATMKDDPQQDPAEGSRANVESDPATKFSASYSGPARRDTRDASDPVPSGSNWANSMGGVTSDQVMSMAGDVARELPSRIDEAMNAVGATATRLKAEDEETLTAFYAAGLGLTLGLLFAGANRLLVLFALAPTAFLGATLFGRLRGTIGTTGRPSTGTTASRGARAR